MQPLEPSGTIKTGHTIVTFLLVLGLLFGAFAIVSMAFGFARHGDSLLYGRPLTLAFQLSPDDIHGLPQGVRLTDWPDVQVDIADPSSKQMALRSALDLGPLILVLGGLWLLRGFLRSVLDGDPFGAANVRRLRSIGFILVIGAPLVALLEYSLRLALYDNAAPHVAGNLASKGFELPAAALLGGLGVFILAEVFAYGLRLREDVESTI